MRAGHLLLAAAIVGCGDDGGEDDNFYNSPRVCEGPTGAWRFVLHERSGDCDIGEDLEYVMGLNGSLSDFTAEDECVGPSRTSANGCESTVAQRCPLKNPAGQLFGAFEIHGYLRLLSTTRISGEFTVSYLFNDGDSCIATFEVRGQRR